jgi:DNA-binding transcriptional MocR family regulator
VAAGRIIIVAMAKPTPARVTRYRDIADRLEHALRGGTYRSGQRLPSVRQLCRNWRASITTVVAAYRLLESRGLVEARAQSGHFALPPLTAPAPDMARGRLVPSEVGLGQLALMVMKDALDPRLVQFGPAMPDPGLLPTAEIHRLIAAIGRAGESGAERYGVPPGSAELRGAISRRAAGFGCAFGPDQLITTAGALEALTLALRATCRAGQTVAIESPMYYGLLQSIEALGLRVIEIPTHPRHGISLETLREALDEHEISAVVALPGGGNPLGSLCSVEAKRELVALLSERRIPLIEDDVIGELCHHGGRPPPAKAFDREGLVLWCSSLSKTAAPGLRVGWISAGRYQEAVEHLQFTNAIGPSPLTQEVAARFLSGGAYDRCLRRARAAYAVRCAEMGAAVLRTFPAGTRVSQPAAGFCLWVEMPVGVDAQAVYAAALRAGISITPGPLFSAKLHYRHFIRLNAARWSAAALPALRRLAGLVAAAQRGAATTTRPAHPQR